MIENNGNTFQQTPSRDNGAASGLNRPLLPDEIDKQSPSRKKKQKSNDFEQTIKDKMQKTMKAKVDGRKYSSKDKSSSKKALQK